MGLIGAIVGIVAGIITIFVDGRQFRWPSFLSGSKWWKAVLVFAVVGAISFGLVFAGSVIAQNTREVEKLGGVDLSGYCASYEFKGSQDMGCQSPIDLGDACDKRWDREGDNVKFTDPNDPNSGVCVTASGRDTRKGIDNLPDYCQEKYPLTHNVTAISSPPKNWVCRTKIDPALACSWQFQLRNVVARKDSADDQWKCYEEKQGARGIFRLF